MKIYTLCHIRRNKASRFTFLRSLYTSSLHGRAIYNQSHPLSSSPFTRESWYLIFVQITTVFNGVSVQRDSIHQRLVPILRYRIVQKPQVFEHDTRFNNQPLRREISPPKRKFPRRFFQIQNVFNFLIRFLGTWTERRWRRQGHGKRGAASLGQPDRSAWKRSP